MGKADELLKDFRQQRSVGGYRSSSSSKSCRDASPPLTLNRSALTSRHGMSRQSTTHGFISPDRRSDDLRTVGEATTSVRKEVWQSTSPTQSSTLGSSIRRPSPRKLTEDHADTIGDYITPKAALSSISTASYPFSTCLKTASSSGWTRDMGLEELDRKMARMRETLAKLSSETLNLNQETGELREKVNQGLTLHGKRRGILGKVSKRKPLSPSDLAVLGDRGNNTKHDNDDDDDDGDDEDRQQQLSSSLLKEHNKPRITHISIPHEQDLSLAISSSSEDEEEEILEHQSLPSMRSDVFPPRCSDTAPSIRSTLSFAPGRPPTVPSSRKESSSHLRQHVASFLSTK